MRSRRDLGASSNLSRRGFIAGGVSGALVLGSVGISARSFRAEEPAHFELSELTIADLQEGMAKGKYTSRSLAEKYLLRIETIDRKGPTLRDRKSVV